MKSKEKLNNGITLVALVITIIILLILAGISIQAITNTGIFTQANNAKRESEIANIKEQIALDIYEKQLEPPLGSITDEQLETILGKYGTVNKEDGTIVGITIAKGYEILLKDIYGGETVAETVPDGATVTPVNDITTWLKTGEISKQYSYTTIEQVIADTTCTQSLMRNENAMKYLARSTEFANAICASETAMTYLGQSAYVDNTVLNSDIWVESVCNSTYFESVLKDKVPTMTSNTTPSGKVSANSENGTELAYYAFDNNNNNEDTWVLDNNAYTNWSTTPGITNGYIQYEFANPICVKCVKMSAYRLKQLGRTVQDVPCTLSASNDGASWTTLDSDITFYASTFRGDAPVYNNNSYLYYRLTFPKENDVTDKKILLNYVQFFGRSQN